MKKNFLLFTSALLCTVAVVMAQPTQPTSPLSGNSSNCSTAVSETCTGGSSVITNFTNATLRSGSPTALPAVYTFHNIATVSGQQINAIVTVESQSNCDMTGSYFVIDDDAATDQDGNSITSFFAPRITPYCDLTTTDVRGYVQFTINFYKENGSVGEQYPGDYTLLPAAGGLAGLNYLHYDIDGSCIGTNGWFRETGVVQNVTGLLINGDASTELNSYAYTHGNNWKGFAGSVYERTGVSRCAQTVAAAKYNLPQTKITFRMGYDYNYTDCSFNERPTRQYGSRFGCFDFPQQSTLPVKLLGFSGTLKNNTALLNWSADNQINFIGYEIERSTDGINFSSVGLKTKQGEGLQRADYQYNDDLYAITEKTFFYRLKMLDIDGKYSYSNVIMLRKDGSITKGLHISPNPASIGSNAMVRLDAQSSNTIEIRVIDLSGKIVLKQTNNVYEGSNSISINNLNRLQSGMYLVQVQNGSDVQTTKLSLSR
jgi:hypothetical protein